MYKNNIVKISLFLCRRHSGMMYRKYENLRVNYNFTPFPTVTNPEELRDSNLQVDFLTSLQTLWQLEGCLLTSE